VLSPLQPTGATLFPPQTATLQQVTAPPTQVTGGQVTSVATAASIAQPSISVAALQTAGLSLNPAIVRMRDLLLL